jgi:molybdenum cofactor cytidylyltransferase
VVLAAGGSRRLGHPKQLVVHQGATLLERTIRAALEAGADPIIVVLGSSAATIRSAMPPFPERVHFAVNQRWAEGMGSSIACGVGAFDGRDMGLQAAMLLVCDQPALDAAVLQQLMQQAAKEPQKILLADYGSGRGPPVVFPSRFFNELRLLQGDNGARDVHRRHAEDVRTVAFPGGAIDIDTPADLDRTLPGRGVINP